ncbi:MAG: hypothetical protein RIR26_1491 [Pseudomonadota bacterium]|jgi:uncharacterized membrane protein YbhN (UPF0104 family)
MRKTLIKTVILVSVAITFLYFMDRAGLLKWSAILSAFRNHPYEILAVAILQILTAVVMMIRYGKLLHLFGIDAGWRQVAAATFVSQALGQWFPGSLAIIEVLRVGLMSGARPSSEAALKNTGQASGLKARLAIVSLVDRLVGFLGILLAGFFSCVIVFYRMPDRALSVSTGVLALGLFSGLGVVLLLGLPFAVRFPPLVRALKMSPKEAHAARAESAGLVRRLVFHAAAVRHDIEAGTRHPLRLLFPIFLSVSSMLLTSASLSFAGASLSVDLDFSQIVCVFPMVALAGLLPLGFAGMGGYQLVLASVFSLFAVPPSFVASAGVLQSAVLLVVNTLLGLLFVRECLLRFTTLRAKTQLPTPSP